MKTKIDKKEYIKIYIYDFKIIMENKKYGINRKFDILEESSKECFIQWLRHYGKYNYKVLISSEDLYRLRKLRYI